MPIAPTPDPAVISYVTGELTPAEETAYNEVLFTGLGTGHGKPSTTGKAQPNASTGSAIDLHKDKDETKFKSLNPLPLDLSVEIDPKPETPLLSLPLDLSFTSVLDMLDTQHKVLNYDECAMQDKPLTPSLPVKIKDESTPKMPTTAQLKSDIRISVKKLDLHEGQLVKVTQEMLDELPPKKDTAQFNTKDEGQLDIDQDSESLASTILYSWVDKPVLQVSHIPEHYMKPKYKLPDSLMSPKAKSKELAKFSVKMHGIIKCKPKYGFKCSIGSCRQSFPSIKLWNTHHTAAHKKSPLTCSICQRSFQKPSAHRAHCNAHAVHKYVCNTCYKSLAYISALR